MTQHEGPTLRIADERDLVASAIDQPYSAWEQRIVVRGGTVIDGSGTPPRRADVAFVNGTITAVGDIVSEPGDVDIDAAGKLVIPGFVDIHTHYDGQATWDSHLAPSSWHGVTTAVMGNCGVGFAPVHDEDHDRLIELMEGVEDIPGAALDEGLPWKWNTFAEYLDFLETVPRDIDLGAQVPHGALRLHVMGERGARQEPANPDDIAAMAELARDAVVAGALGFTTSRTMNHRSSNGEYTPSLRAEADELVGIAEALGSVGQGVLQIVSDMIDQRSELAMFEKMGAQSGRPVSVSVAQASVRPDDWRIFLDYFTEATERGVPMRGQVGARGVGILMGLENTLSPFMLSSTYGDLAELPLAERVAKMREPEIRAQILAEVQEDQKVEQLVGGRLIHRFDMMFALGNPPNYEPDPADSIAARAAEAGVSPESVAYDVLIGEGAGDSLTSPMLYVPMLNYVNGSLGAVGEQLAHPNSLPGLSDGGAHVGTICDGSFPTTLLQWWGRDRPEGRLPLEHLVHRPCRATAEAVGLLDRGLLQAGYKADLNVIDFDNLRLHSPEIHHDLPAGGRRLLQRADGYCHTFVSGVEIRRENHDTGLLPGQLIRGGQPAPEAAA